MDQSVKLVIDGQTVELPVVVGAEGEKAIDISRLRQLTGYITLDPGFGNTGACTSGITFMNGEDGVLRHRGIPVEQLAEHSTFAETAYLLIHGDLPTAEELASWKGLLNLHSLVHEDMQNFYQNFPRGSHPMGILSAMISALTSFYPALPTSTAEDLLDTTTTRLIAKIRTMAAMSYRISRGHRVVYPRPDLDYCSNFLNMMFDNPVKPYEIHPSFVKALNVFWILHADHEQNCSTSAVRLVGSARVNLYAAISAGVSALWGPLHGGANQAVIEMLRAIHEGGESLETVIQRAKNPDDEFRLMGFGHRVYKTRDPRAKIMKKVCDELLEELHISDPLLNIAVELEGRALEDEYFLGRNLYPNVDFYSGIVLRALGIPTSMFTVMFAIGRLPGWIAQWREGADDPGWKLNRPRQIYTGPTRTDYVPIAARG